MDLSDITMSAADIWPVTLLVAAVDALLILAARGVISPRMFGRLAGWAALFAFLFFTALWSFVLAWAWDDFYSFVFPLWMRRTGLAWGAAYGLVGFGMAWLSKRLPGRPTVNFCLLGGLEGLLTHLWAVFGAGILEKPPMFSNVDPLTILVFATFEKMFYWILILFLAAGAAQLSRGLRRPVWPVSDN